MPIKLVGIDIDGTLLDSRGELPQENAVAIANCMEKGIRIILLTGRRWGMARKVSAMLKLPSPLVAHNGALIKTPDTLERLAASFIGREVAAEILEQTRAYLHYTVLHRDHTPDGQTVVHPSCLENNLMMKSYLSQAAPDSVLSTSSLAQTIDPQLIQIMFGGELSVMLEIEHALQTSGLLSDVSLSKTYYPQKNLGIIDILDKRGSKAVALKFLAESYGVQREEVLAIGDNHNDLEMLEYAGIGVIVANCVEDLKGRGFRDTLTNNEAGVAKALRQYVD